MVLQVRQSEEKDFEKIKPGTHPAVCTGVFDLGHQKTPFKNEDGSDKYQWKLLVVWQTAVNDSEGNPFYQIKQYTNSFSEKANLRADVKGWKGKDLSPEEIVNFDLESLIGQQCTLSIVHSDDGKWANVNSVSPAMEGMEVTSLNENPEWVGKIVKKAVERSQGQKLPPPEKTPTKPPVNSESGDSVSDQDVPF